MLSGIIKVEVTSLVIHCFEENNNKQPATKHRRTLKIRHFAPNLPSEGERGGGGTSHMKRVGMLVGNFELNPLKETDLGVAQPFFDP